MSTFHLKGRMATLESQEANCRIVLDRILELEMKGGSTPDFHKGVMIEDRLLIVDSDFNECNLKIYNSLDGKKIFTSVKMVSEPRDICFISTMELAVCLWTGKIVIFSLDSSTDDIKQTKTFDVRTRFDFCHSVTKWNSDKIIVSGVKDAKLCWSLVSIKDESHFSNHDICNVKSFGSFGLTDAVWTCVDANDDTVYISCCTFDFIVDGVYAFDFLNPHKPKFVYQNHELREPWSIIVDKYVYVCGRNSYTIHQLSHTGQLMTIHRLASSVYGMFYDDQHGVLSTISYKSNVLTLYKIEYLHEAGIPTEILSMDDRSIQRFKNALKDGAETIYSIRIMVVGAAGVGKTTLVKRLLGEKVDISERQSTEGIDLYVNCTDVSLFTKEWITQENISKQDYALQRLVKILNENYQATEYSASQEQDATSQQEKTNQSLINTAHDNSIEVIYQRTAQSIDQNLDSTMYHQRSPSSDVQRYHTLPDRNVKPGKGVGDIQGTECLKTDPLREMLQLLKKNQYKARLSVEKYAHLSVYDFAGQYAFYTTHQMFLSRRAIYLLVADVSLPIDNVVEDECFFDSKGKIKCKDQELLEIWLNSIHSCASINTDCTPTSSSTVIQPPVILVGTHVDEIQLEQSVIKAVKEYEQPQMQNVSVDATKSSQSMEQRKRKATGRKGERKVKRRKGKETEADLFSSSQKAGICTYPKDLYQVLHSSTPDTFTSRYTLERNCQGVGLQIHGKTPHNGNCFFEAVSSQLKRLNFPVQKSPEQLRQAAVVFLKENPLLKVSTGNINFADFIYKESFKEYCERMEKDGEWADHIMVLAMARTLQRNIMIVTSSPSSGNGDSIALVVGQDSCVEDPVLLGHIWEHHYESLEPIYSALKAKQWSQLDIKQQFKQKIQLYRQMRGQEYLTEIRSYLGDKPVVCHLVDEEFAIDNSIVNRRLEDLKRKILDVASQQPYWGEQIPTRWFLLEQQLMILRDAGMKVISHRVVEQLNKEGTVEIEDCYELELFLKYLHETGTVIYFSIEILKDNIILDPLWLITALKLLINAQPSVPGIPAITKEWWDFKEKGILSTWIVDAIWTMDKYPDLHAHKDHLLRIMEQFNIITTPISFCETGVKVENYFLVPCMLHQESPKEVISPVQDSKMMSSSVLCYVFIGKFLPPPIFHRLLAACIAHWPVAKNKETKENLIFCGSCVFDLDLFHRLTLHVRSHIIYVKITRLTLDDIKTLDARLCSRVRKFITLNLSKIISYLGQNLRYELCIESPSSEGMGYHLSPPFDMWLDEGLDTDMPITHEHMNHARLCVALITICGNAMREILRTHFNHTEYTDIYQEILANRAMLTTQQGRRKPLLNSDQIHLVFANHQGQDTGTLEQFDISLLYVLIRNISSVPAPITGWGIDPIDRSPRDSSLGASVERIRLYRNVFGNIRDGKINSQDFQEYWNKIEDVLHDIENVIGGHAYSQQLEKQRRCVISVYEAI